MFRVLNSIIFVGFFAGAFATAANAEAVLGDRVNSAFNAIDNPAQTDTIAEAATAADQPHTLSTDDLARELNNPNSVLSSLTLKNVTTFYGGDLPDADGQVGNYFQFQPVFPFPLTADGTRNFYVRPAFTLFTHQPTFDASRGRFGSEFSLGDVGFDVAVGQSFDSGLIAVAGIQGTLPVFSELSGDQLRLGPEAVLAYINKAGVLAIFPQHQWNVVGNGPNYSSTTLEIIATKFLGNGWSAGTDSKIAYDWEADQWTIPINATIKKVVRLGNTPVQLSAAFDYYVERNDSFGPDFGLTFSVTPTVPNFIYNALKN
jgi:hypothetical protein